MYLDFSAYATSRSIKEANEKHIWCYGDNEMQISRYGYLFPFSYIWFWETVILLYAFKTKWIKYVWVSDEASTPEGNKALNSLAA